MPARMNAFLSRCCSRFRAWVKACLPVVAAWMKDAWMLYAAGFFLGLGFWFALAVVLAFCGSGKARAAEEAIPRAALEYRAPLIRTARTVWGMDAPVAVFAAQIHTESRWKKDARSPVGAEGLAQFMPDTAAWIPSAAPSLKGKKPAPYNPGWAMRALCEYDLWLWKRVENAASGCDRMAFALSGYNGGLGWVQKDRARARDKGLDPARYEQVAAVNAGRNRAAWKENRDYVRLIMTRQHLYMNAGWGRGCAD